MGEREFLETTTDTSRNPAMTCQGEQQFKGFWLLMIIIIRLWSCFWGFGFQDDMAVR
jgi:hypothetical protein